jgi:hypothetical protein
MRSSSVSLGHRRSRWGVPRTQRRRGRPARSNARSVAVDRSSSESASVVDALPAALVSQASDAPLQLPPPLRCPLGHCPGPMRHPRARTPRRRDTGLVNSSRALQCEGFHHRPALFHRTSELAISPSALSAETGQQAPDSVARLLFRFLRKPKLGNTRALSPCLAEQRRQPPGAPTCLNGCSGTGYTCAARRCGSWTASRD